MSKTPAFCDLGIQFRKWMLSIADVRNYVNRGNGIIDTIDSDNCPHPFIWYSRSGTKKSNTLVSCGGVELVTYEIEIVDHERKLRDTRNIAELLRKSADEHERPDAFGDTFVQMLEIDDIDDRYEPKVIHFLKGICFTAMRVEITPLVGIPVEASSSSV